MYHRNPKLDYDPNCKLNVVIVIYGKQHHLYFQYAKYIFAEVLNLKLCKKMNMFTYSLERNRNNAKFAYKNEKKS